MSGKLQHAGLRSRPVPNGLGSGGKRGGGGGSSTPVADRVAQFEQGLAHSAAPAATAAAHTAGKKQLDIGALQQQQQHKKKKKKKTHVPRPDTAAKSSSDEDEGFFRTGADPPNNNAGGNQQGSSNRERQTAARAKEDIDYDMFHMSPVAVLHNDRNELLQIVSGMVRDQISRQVALSSDPFYSYVRKVAGALMNGQTADDLLHMAESNVHKKFLDGLQELEKMLHPHAAKHVQNIHAHMVNTTAIKTRILDQLQKLQEDVQGDHTEQALALNRSVGELLKAMQSMEKSAVLPSRNQVKQGIMRVRPVNQQVYEGWVFVIQLVRTASSQTKELLFQIRKKPPAAGDDEASGTSGKRTTEMSVEQSREQSREQSGEPSSFDETDSSHRNAPKTSATSGARLLLHTGVRHASPREKFYLTYTDGDAERYLDPHRKNTEDWIKWFRDNEPELRVHIDPDQEGWQLPPSSDRWRGKNMFSTRQNPRSTTVTDRDELKRWLPGGENTEERIMNMYRVNRGDVQVSQLLRDTINTLDAHTIPHQFNQRGAPTMWAHPRPTVQFFTRPGNFDETNFYLRPDLEVAAGKALEGVREAYDAVLQVQGYGGSGNGMHPAPITPRRMYEHDVVVDFASLTALYLNIQERMSAKRYYSSVDTQFRMMEINSIRERLGNTLLRNGCARDGATAQSVEILDWTVVMVLDADANKTFFERKRTTKSKK